MPESQPLLILGSYLLAEELVDLISEIPGYKVVGLVENYDRDRCSGTIAGLPVHWIDDIGPFLSSHLVLGGISTTHRRGYIEDVAARGVRFATLVHPMARLSRLSLLGEGSFLSPGVIVASNTVIGAHVFVNRGALIGHHTTIEDYVTIQPGANIAGVCQIGSGAYIGMNAVILDRITVGKGAVVGAGAVVTRNVPDQVQVIGVPARIVKENIDGK